MKELPDTELDLRDAPVRAAVPEDLRGRVVGAYILDDELGRGGMGRVYRAHHHILGHQVAVKLCLDLGPNAYRAVLREGRAMAKLRDAHVVRVLDVGVEDSLGPYLAMELLAGPSLDRLLEAGPLDPARAQAIALDLAFALHAAHSAALVHRDLKPSNVIVEPTVRGPQAKVLDFGIVKPLSGDQPSTATGRLVGTPLYMSPEQWRSEGVTTRSDVWAFGVILFEMLTGTLPFEAGSPWELCVLVNESSATRLRTLDPSLPAALDQLAADCLQRDPEARPSAAEIVSRLGATPVAVRPSRRWPAAAGAAFALLSCAAVAIAMRSQPRTMATSPARSFRTVASPATPVTPAPATPGPDVPISPVYSAFNATPVRKATRRAAAAGLAAASPLPAAPAAPPAVPSHRSGDLKREDF